MTSVHTYFFKGVNGVPENFHRSKNAVKDKAVAVQGTNNFNGKAVTTVPDANGKKTVYIDDAVEITTVPDTVRKAAEDNWSQLAEKSRKTFVATLITGIVLTVVGVALGVAAFAYPPLVIAAVPVFVIGVALLIVAKRSYSNEKNAKIQKNLWKDPVPNIQEHRRKANPNAEGFNYALQRKNLLGQCFHQDEVLHLREAHLKSFIEKHENGVNTNNVDTFRSFFKLNPFSDDAVKFANGERKGHGMDKLIRDYGSVEGRFNSLLREIQLKRDIVESERKNVLLNLKANRDHDLSIIESRYLTPNIYLEQQKCRGHYDQHGRFISDISTAEIILIQMQIENNKSNYDRAAEPIQERYNRETGKAESIAYAKNLEIAKYERAEILKYKEPIRDLLGQFRHQIKPDVPNLAEDATAPSFNKVNGQEDPSAPPSEEPMEKMYPEMYGNF